MNIHFEIKNDRESVSEKLFDATRRQRTHFKIAFGTSYLLNNEWVMFPVDLVELSM